MLCVGWVQRNILEMIINIEWSHACVDTVVSGHLVILLAYLAFTVLLVQHLDLTHIASSSSSTCSEVTNEACYESVLLAFIRQCRRHYSHDRAASVLGAFVRLCDMAREGDSFTTEDILDAIAEECLLLQPEIHVLD